LRVARERAREGFFLDPSRPRSDVIGDLAPGAIAAQLLLSETGGAERSLAVTGLERFARCAFMGYAHVVLAAREADRKDDMPDAREEGTLVHEALAAAFLATRELWPRRPRPGSEILARGTAAADEVLDRWQGHAPLRAIVRLRVSDGVRAVLGVALGDETWDFALAEQSFGARGDASWGALELSDESGVRLSLRGSIDRVDHAHDGRAARVIDYKRSKTTVSEAARSLGVTALQVPLYACVAARELGLPATGAYVPTQARDIAVEAKPSARAGHRMDELVARSGTSLAEIERRGLAIVASARSGALAPVPAHESECRLCAVSGGCRKPRFAMAPIDDADDDREPRFGRPPDAI
jgi:RecB family exonuclease